MTTGQISRDEMRGALEDKLCAHFAVTGEEATDEGRVFQASAMVARRDNEPPAGSGDASSRKRGGPLPLHGVPRGRSLAKNAAPITSAWPRR
ncbi:MAG: hypothetical protein ACLTSG_04660 [Lachnospiraceae bacterium]